MRLVAIIFSMSDSYSAYSRNTPNGKFRDECLNEHWFRNIRQARIAIEEWLEHYNVDRPHSSLGGLSPYEFIKQSA